MTKASENFSLVERLKATEDLNFEEVRDLKKWLNDHKKSVGSIILIVGIVVAITTILL